MRAACPRVRKDAAHRADTLPGRLQTGRAQGTSVAIAWREYQLHRRNAKERLCGTLQGKRERMSNKREKPLTAALRALCGQAGEGREKQSEKSAETFCFSGFRLPANLLGRWRTFGGFVGNGLDRSVRLNRIVRSIGKWRAIRRDFMRCAQPAVRMDQDPSLHSCLKKFFSTN